MDRMVAELHAAIVNDDSPDTVLESRASNRVKAEAVCKVLGIGMDDLDVSQPLPLAKWFVSGQKRKLTAGLYLSMLQSDFYRAVRRKLTVPSPELEHFLATAEFWIEKFRDALYTLHTGIVPPGRVLH